MAGFGKESGKELDQGFGKELTAEERALLEDVLGALEGMRYGSILLTVHDGRLVEVQKTERIRRSKNPPPE